MELLLSAISQTIRLLRLPLLALAAVFLISLLGSLGKGFLLGSGPVFLAPTAPSRWAVVLIPAGTELPALAGPGEEHPVAHRLAAGDRHIVVTGRKAQTGATLWVEVETPDGDAWVDSTYLTEEVPSGVFATDHRPPEIAARLADVLNTGSDPGSVVSERGLYVAFHAPPRRLDRDELGAMLIDTGSWGWWSPTGDRPAVRGGFNQVVARPLLDALTSWRPRAGAEAAYEIPIELANFNHLTYGDPTQPGQAWRLFFEYLNDEPRLVAIWREGQVNPASLDLAS